MRKCGENADIARQPHDARGFGKRQVVRGVVGVDLVAQDGRRHANNRRQGGTAARVFMHRQIGRSGDVHFLIS
ncbi:hypothetical protein D3C71_911300 [compost metagenome]